MLPYFSGTRRLHKASLFSSVSAHFCSPRFSLEAVSWAINSVWATVPSRVSQQAERRCQHSRMSSGCTLTVWPFSLYNTHSYTKAQMFKAALLPSDTQKWARFIPSESSIWRRSYRDTRVIVSSISDKGSTWLSTAEHLAQISPKDHYRQVLSWYFMHI